MQLSNFRDGWLPRLRTALPQRIDKFVCNNLCAYFGLQLSSTHPVSRESIVHKVVRELNARMTARVLLMRSLGIPFTGSSAVIRNRTLVTLNKTSDFIQGVKPLNALRHASRSYVNRNGYLSLLNYNSSNIPFHQLPKYPSPIVTVQNRYFSSQNNDGSDDGSNNEPASGNISNLGGAGDQGGPVIHSLPATMTVPETWPNVPVIAINRNPVFPRFIKIIEVILLFQHT